MPYCVQCGKQVEPAARFCPSCGAAQQAAGTPKSPADFWANLSDRQAALLCYIPWVGWIASIGILASSRFRRENRIRFHAFQGLYLFVVWLLVDWFLDPTLRFQGTFFGLALLPRLLKLAVFGAWIFMLIKVNNNEDFRLPVIGELADRSVAEQRL